MPAKTLYLHDSTLDFLSRRGETAPGDNASAVTNQTIERYAHVLELGRRHLRETLTEAEMALITDALNGTMLEARRINLLTASIEDAIDIDSLATKWDVDDQALLAKLGDLTGAELMALLDAVERWWLATGSGEQPATYLEALGE